MGLRNALLLEWIDMPRNLKKRCGLIACVTILAGLIGCTARSVVTPADRVRNETFRYDCCDPGLGAADKEWCDLAIKNPDHAFVDTDGNKYEYVWSDCKIGEEPWRKYE